MTLEIAGAVLVSEGHKVSQRFQAELEAAQEKGVDLYVLRCTPLERVALEMWLATLLPYRRELFFAGVRVDSHT